jgi:hypothetical protein
MNRRLRCEKVHTFWYSPEKGGAGREHDVIELNTATATKYAHSRMQNKLQVPLQ